MSKLVKRVVAVIAIMTLSLSLVACGNNDEKEKDATSSETFPEFTGSDLEGNEVSDKLFSENTITVVNLWFTGCSACIKEMPDLSEISKKLEAKGGKMVGMCVDANSEYMKNKAKDIVNKAGADYQNIAVDKNSKAQEYFKNITAFPTTVLVDRNGKIIGSEIVGTIDTEARIKELMKRVDEIIEKDAK